METRRLGRTDLEISVLSIGGLYTSSLAGGEAETRRIMQRAIELGVNAIDTAPAYADSELTVGQAISGLEAPLIITTKLGGRPQPFDPRILTPCAPRLTRACGSWAAITSTSSWFMNRTDPSSTPGGRAMIRSTAPPCN